MAHLFMVQLDIPDEHEAEFNRVYGAAGPKRLSISAPTLTAAMTDKKIVDRLNQIAALYDELAAGQDSGPTDRE